MPEVTRETPSQRMHYRLTVPIFVEIDGKTYKASDWSQGGFRLDGYDGPLSQGELFNPKLSIDFRGFHISFVQESKVVRASKGGDGILAVAFENIKDENRELLKYFSEGLLGGEMASFQDAIRRVDMPVTPVEMELVEEANVPPLRRSLKRILIALMYLILGGAVLIWIFVTLYSNFWRIEVEAGVVVAPTEPLVAPVSGIFEKLIIPEDRSIKLGQPVIHLVDLDNGGNGFQGEIALNAARLRVATLQAQLSAERGLVGIYNRVGDSRLKSAVDRVTALGQELALARNDVARKTSLEQQGVVSKADLEASKQLAERTENDLALAKNDLRIAHVALTGLSRHGLFFSGDRVEGRGVGLSGELAAARKALSELEGVVGGRGGNAGGDLTIYAPFDGHVVRVLKTPGNTVDRGDNLAVIERDDSRYIEVYLTQAESTQVRIGSIAKIFIPSLNITREARVIQIDRARGFIEETDSRYRWRTTVDRTACCTLFFVTPEGKNAQVKDIVTGTPATVSFARYPSNPVWASLFSFFRPGSDKYNEEQAAKQAMQYEFRDVVRMQGPTSRRTEAGTQVTVNLNGKDERAAAKGPNSPAAPVPAPAKAPAPAAAAGAPAPAMAAPVTPPPAPAAPAKAPGASSSREDQSMLFATHFPPKMNIQAVPEAVRAELKREADKALATPPAPVATLASAGQTDKESPQLLASRRGFQDADNAANLALAYRAFGDKRYLEQARSILTAWARVNKPTGQPIDETRLDKMVYAYDLLRGELSGQENEQVLGWFRTMRDMKLAWKFGEKTYANNHHTHQLKMLLLLDRALGDAAGFDKALAEVREHLRVNINASTGETQDYKERTALHYQAYDLEPWLEIAVLAGSLPQPVQKAYEFLRAKILSGDIHSEFTNSTAAIDEKRAKAGFGYAKKGGTFEVAKAARSVMLVRTLGVSETDPAMSQLGGQATAANLYFLVRQQAWQR